MTDLAENKKFKPKYYTKIPLGRDKYRYFYSKEEYMAYLKDKKTAVEEDVKNGLSDITDKGKKLLDNISNKNNVDAKISTTSGKKIVDSVLNTNKQTKTSASLSSSETKKAVSKIAEKGKQVVDDHLNKISDQAVKSPETVKIVKEVAKKAIQWARGGLVKIVVDELKENAREKRQAELDKEKAKKAAEFLPTAEQQQEQLEESREAIEELKNSDDLLPGLDIKDEPNTDIEDMEAINPYYNGDNNYAYSNNCAYCTAAYELRQRGYDVEAAGVGYSTANTIETICDWYEGEEVTTSSDLIIENGKYSISAEEACELVVEDLVEHGDGARGQFLLYWRNGGGHSVAWEVVDDKVVLRDCQTNETVNLIDYVQLSQGFAYFRTDNVELSDKITEAVVNRDESRYVEDHE